MVKKKYQFFISSTYEDLKEERKKLFWAVLKKKYIPVGMELFGAVDEEQMTYIKRLIDDCDCFVVLLGGRYGSVDGEGISYTEREYDYAVQQEKKVIALVYETPESLPPEKRDNSEELRKKFQAFRDKVTKAKRLVSQWKDMTELVENLHISIEETIQTFPLIGWVRDEEPTKAELVDKIVSLELEIQRLKESTNNPEKKQIATDLKIEACSTTNPSFYSETEIECVSLAVCYQMNKIDMSLFSSYPTIISKDNILRYYRDEVLPWFIQMARICKIDLRVTNPFPFAVNNIEWEDCLIDKDGTVIAIPKRSNYIGDPPRNPDYYSGKLNHMTVEGEFRFNLNPKRPKLLTSERFYRPEQDQDMIYQCKFYAENIVEPVEKEIKVHFRVLQKEFDFNQLIRIIQRLEAKERLNDVGVFAFVQEVLALKGKEQDSCDTPK